MARHNSIMPQPFLTTRRVEFHDTDAAGIMHFSCYFRFMEEAEHELLRDLGLSVIHRDESGTMSWPRVAAECEFHGAVKFEDVVQIEVRVRHLGQKSVMYGFRLTHDGRDVATGKMTVVCCRLSEEAPPKSISIPDWIVEKLKSRLQ